MNRQSVLAALDQGRRLAGFAAFYAWELVASNAALTWDIVTPSTRVAPGVVRFPMRCRTEFEIALLVNLLSLTPGTLVLEVRRDPPEAFVHGMYAPDAERYRDHLRGLEHRMLAAVRRDGDVATPEGDRDGTA
ncbi:hypothetical protein GCM10027447_03040 [Glycomyces halotolerans]